MRSDRAKKRTAMPPMGNGRSNGSHDEEHALGTIEAPGSSAPRGNYRTQLEESNSNARAMFTIIEALSRVSSVDEGVTTAIETVREAFGWAYGSYWTLDQDSERLRFSLESGRVNEEFRKVTEKAS